MDSKTHQEVERRLKSVEGHIRGVMRMVNEEKPCMAVVQQIQAVQGSLKQTQMLLLQQHLETCLCDLGKQDPERMEYLRKELVTLFDRSQS